MLKVPHAKDPELIRTTSEFVKTVAGLTHGHVGLRWPTIPGHNGAFISELTYGSYTTVLAPTLACYCKSFHLHLQNVTRRSKYEKCLSSSLIKSIRLGYLRKMSRHVAFVFFNKSLKALNYQLQQFKTLTPGFSPGMRPAKRWSTLALLG